MTALRVMPSQSESEFVTAIMVRAVKRKHADLADKTSLSAMTPEDIKKMNVEFGQIASTPKLADRMSKKAA